MNGGFIRHHKSNTCLIGEKRVHATLLRGSDEPLSLSLSRSLSLSISFSPSLPTLSPTLYLSLSLSPLFSLTLSLYLNLSLSLASLSRLAAPHSMFPDRRPIDRWTEKRLPVRARPRPLLSLLASPRFPPSSAALPLLDDGDGDDDAAAAILFCSAPQQQQRVS